MVEDKKHSRPRVLEEARRRPALLLIGLTVGIACAWLAGLFSPVFVPLLPLLVEGGRAVQTHAGNGLGVLAGRAECWAFRTKALLFMVF